MPRRYVDEANPGVFTYANGQARGPKRPVRGLNSRLDGPVLQRDERPLWPVQHTNGDARAWALRNYRKEDTT